MKSSFIQFENLFDTSEIGFLQHTLDFILLDLSGTSHHVISSNEIKFILGGSSSNRSSQASQARGIDIIKWEMIRYTRDYYPNNSNSSHRPILFVLVAFPKPYYETPYKLPDTTQQLWYQPQHAYVVGIRSIFSYLQIYNNCKNTYTNMAFSISFTGFADKSQCQYYFEKDKKKF